MGVLTDVYLNLLGVGELIENISAVVQDKLGKKRKLPGSLAGKTAIITGGNAGVGYATAEALLAAGTDVVLACRSAERAQEAAARLAASSGAAIGPQRAAPTAGSVAVEVLDLADLSSVRRFVQRWRASGRQLDLLICNAGVMCPPAREQTKDGFELQFQSNYLAHYELVNRLVRHEQQQRRQGRRRLQGCQQEHSGRSSSSGGGGGGGSESSGKTGSGGGSASSSGGGSASSSSSSLRVIWLTSMTHFGGDLSDAELADVPYCQRRYNPFQAYATSKLCTLLAAKHLDRLFARGGQQASGSSSRGGGQARARLSPAAAASGQGEHDVSVAVHPGLVDTFLARNYFKGTAPRLLRPLSDPFFDAFFCPYLLRSPQAAADTVLYAATAPAGEVGGAYVGTAPRVGHHSQAAGDPRLAERLWELSAHLCDLGAQDLVA